MSRSLIDPSDPIERQNEKLLKIVSALISRVEDSTDASGAAYAQFQRAALLEQEVRARTRDLERALDLLNESNARLAQANRETEAARSNLANAIETVQEGFALFNPDEELVMCNSRFGMHMPDIRDHLLPGLKFTQYVDLISRSRNLSLPETLTPDAWARQRLQRHEDAHVIFNVRLTRNRWVQVSEHRTQDGGTVIIQTDVTDIMRIERQERDRILDDQARLVRATLEHLDQGICIFNSSGRLVGWNNRASELLSVPAHRFQMGTLFATLFGYLREEFTHDVGFDPVDVEEWAGRQKNRPPLSFEIRRGDTRILSVFAQEMPDHGFVFSFTDVTAERRAARALLKVNESLEARVAARTKELAAALQDAERANATKSRFVAAASHDLLQPLSAAKLYVASLHGNANPGVEQVVRKAESALSSVEHILEALLDISKLDSGRASVHISTVSLGALLAQLADELGPLAQAKGLDLRVVPTRAIVRSDTRYLRRILQNLMSNAIRYTETGRILVGTRRAGDSVRIEVWDTGVGIPPDKQEIVFREFQRLHSDASAAVGMGLGLAIVERACSLLDHPLVLCSAEGRGTMFSVQVPVETEFSAAIDRSTGRAEMEQGEIANVIALLLEDDDNLRNAITMTLESWGVHVLDCASEAEAGTLLREIGVVPDVILVDNQLADGKFGLDAVGNLRAEFGDVPACIVTADRSFELPEGVAGPDTNLLYKPLDPADLSKFLKTHASAAPRS